jgi:hypothetical protein
MLKESKKEKLGFSICGVDIDLKLWNQALPQSIMQSKVFVQRENSGPVLLLKVSFVFIKKSKGDTSNQTKMVRDDLFLKGRWSRELISDSLIAV